MKDYTFGNVTYKQNFILGYTREENNRYLVAHYASGRIETYENNLGNEQGLLKRMATQIEIANNAVHNGIIDYSKTNLRDYLKMYSMADMVLEDLGSITTHDKIDRLNYLKNYFMVQSVIKDIDKNKLLLDNMNYLNAALAYDMRWTLKLPFPLHDKLVWGNLAKGIGSFRFTLNEADAFTLKEIELILETLKYYNSEDSRFPKRELVRKEEQV